MELYGSETSLQEFNLFLRKKGYQLISKSRGTLLQEACVRKNGRNYGGWVDRKFFYDKEDVILFANHLLLGTESNGYYIKYSS